MDKNDALNPFPVSGYHSPGLFCNRETETKLLLDNALNGINTTLLSLRRMGKTGLLRHALHRLHQKKKGTGIYVDVFDTESLRDFTNNIATALLQAFPEKHPFWKKAMEFIKLLRPVITFDELSGQPQVTLDYAQPKQYEHTLQGIFSFLEERDKLVVVAIDEFQQITAYPEKNIEALLRTQIQKLKNVRFIFSGSSPHLLAEMFHHAKRPFFASAQTLELNEMDETEYRNFIARQFAAHKRKISAQTLDFILHFTKAHTFYTQALCNKIFAAGEKDIQPEHAQAAAHSLLRQNETVYFQYRSLLTANQWNMLKAIAREDKMYAPNSKEIAGKYRLGSSSVVQRSIEALLSKEMIYAKETDEGRFYRVYDCFLSRWLEQK